MRCALVLLLLFSVLSYARGGHSGSSHSSKSSKTQGNKTVHVHGYYRKDGTYVAPYDRSAPGTMSHTSSATLPRPYTAGYPAYGQELHPTVQRDSHGRIKRNKAAKNAFEREHACPSTGMTHGRCPGYVVDHVNPLECGGADDPSNMQWQTTENAKAKDKTEKYCR